MQASNPTHQRGSFTKPDALVKSIGEHEASSKQVAQKPQEEKKEDLAQAPVAAAEEKSKEQTAEEKRQFHIDEFKKQCEKEHGLVIGEEDLINYLFKGVLAKEMKINNFIKGTFQTLRTDDIQSIDKMVAKARDEGVLTSQGMANEEAVITLSYAWTHADGKSLGSTPEERMSKIKKMGSIFVSNASEARINLETLVKFLLYDGKSTKK